MTRRAVRDIRDRLTTDNEATVRLGRTYTVTHITEPVA